MSNPLHKMGTNNSIQSLTSIISTQLLCIFLKAFIIPQYTTLNLENDITHNNELFSSNDYVLNNII